MGYIHNKHDDIAHTDWFPERDTIDTAWY